MADVGKSTTGHSKEDTESQRRIERMLVNWGNWLATVEQPGPGEYAIQPMFKEYIAGYRVVSERRSAEDAEKAEMLDRTLARLDEKDISCLICNYVLRFNSRQASRFLKEVESHVPGQPRRKGRSVAVTDRGYVERLNVAVTNAEIAVAYATGLDLTDSQLYGAKRVVARKKIA